MCFHRLLRPFYHAVPLHLRCNGLPFSCAKPRYVASKSWSYSYVSDLSGASIALEPHSKTPNNFKSENCEAL